MTKSTRWLKVTISYREGERLDQWNAVELAETSMVLEIANPQSIGTAVDDLESSVGMAAVELVIRAERLSPPVVEPEAVLS